MQYCSLQHQTLLLSPDTPTTGYCFCFGSIPSFCLELFLHWSPVVYWATTDLGSSSFSITSFCLFILFMGFSRQEYWSGLPFPSPVDHILPGYWDPISDLKTVHNLPYSWGLGSPTVSSYQLHVAVGNLPSIPHFLKHGPHWSPHTGSTFCIFLFWPHHDPKFLYDGSSVERREGRWGTQGQNKLSLFPDLYRVPGKQRW